ncbi:hypothetical protein [Marinobacter sp.]|uniref:hypothetical protein n=1 Tax=Marinobacter sp. TaxID=50741 RepID=UPI003A944A1E
MLKSASRLCGRALLAVSTGLFILIVFTAPAFCVAADKQALLSIEGISASMGEDEPRVLNILPWRAPTLPRRPEAELENTAAELLQPLDPLVLERHREFRQKLGVANPEVRTGEWQ